MILVLALAAAERLINTAIRSDAITADGMGRLTGKTLRVVINSPALSVDVLFCDDGVRFEPVVQSVFEPKNGAITHQPDCTLTVENPVHLLEIIKNPTGNLPIRGDHHLLMQLKTLMENFEPDFWEKIEQLLGRQATSHLYLLGQEFSPIAKPIIDGIKEIGSDFLGLYSKPANQLDAEILAKKQQLLALQSDIEREQARLTALKNQLDQLAD
ncbi:SCP2 domain-containing protein [Moraxella sp.]|uniref:ubiquinone biosynthesis accessory factor UbiJ n=1 Tax=Moraxella sp. TaxID=479 RepID=UPI0026DB1EA2|nr:hypothetical protein [Moraxella sp.]MDO4894467.1 hypothetical protein [Moraxella sp.]